MLVLVRKEFLGHLRSLRFGLTLACTVVLVVLVSAVGSQIFSERMDRYRANRQAAEEGLAQDTVYAQVRPRVILPPTPLSIFAVGVATSVTTEVTVSPFHIPDSPSFGGPTTNSDFMKAVVQVDLATLVAVVLSFLAVALGYDGLCGERERGTLRQLLSNPVPRARVLLAKLLSGWLILTVSLAMAFVCALLVVQLNPDVHLTSVEWIRLGLLYAVSVLFLAVIFALSLMVSSLTRDSATSLVLCLFGWLAGGGDLPQPAAGGGRVRCGGRHLADLCRRLSRRPPAAGRGSPAVGGGPPAAQRCAHEGLPARGVNMISPGYAFEYATQAMLGTGLSRYLDFERQAWHHRDALREDLRARDAADPSSPHLHFLPGYLSRQALDPQALPRFHQQPVSMARSLAGGVVPLALLATEACLALVLALCAVNRMAVVGP